MKYTDLKVGDIITILEEPALWNSSLCNEKPLGKDIFPYTGVVKAIKNSNGYSTSAHIGDYGWSIDTPSFKFEIAKLENYEIY